MQVRWDERWSKVIMTVFGNKPLNIPMQAVSWWGIKCALHWIRSNWDHHKQKRTAVPLFIHLSTAENTKGWKTVVPRYPSCTIYDGVVEMVTCVRLMRPSRRVRSYLEPYLDPAREHRNTSWGSICWRIRKGAHNFPQGLSMVESMIEPFNSLTCIGIFTSQWRCNCIVWNHTFRPRYRDIMGL